jgi:haloalkane dehalogenase
MRRLAIAALGLGALVLVAYTVGLGVYAVASTRPAVPSQPATPAEARAVVRALGIEAEYPFDSRFVRTPHGRMHYVEAGAGDPVLCVHGNPTWSFLYRNFLRGLSGSARVVAPDLIGFGLSEKPSDPDAYTIEGHVEDLSALIEALDLRRITLVVHDWGGPIGLGAALRHPDRIRALVVINTVGFLPAARSGPPLALRLVRLPLVGEQLVQGLGAFHRVLLPAGIARPERRDDRVVGAYLQVQGSWAERAGTLAFPRLIPRDGQGPVAELLAGEDRFLRGFRGPALVAWGMRDPVFRPALLDEWRERLPHAKVLELPGASHFAQEDAWEEIVPRVAAMLATGR